jgi:hypothetical protein
MARRKRGRRRGRRYARAAGGTALLVIAGGVTALGYQALAERVDVLARNWYLGPLAIGALGFLLRKKPKYAGAGNALLGVAGYTVVQQYQLAKATERAGGVEAAALLPEYGYDAGALLDPGEPDLLASNVLTSAGAPRVKQPTVAVSAGEAETLGMFG